MSRLQAGHSSGHATTSGRQETKRPRSAGPWKVRANRLVTAATTATTALVLFIMVMTMTTAALMLIVMMMAVIVAVVNFIVDIIAALIDPRVRY